MSSVLDQHVGANEAPVMHLDLVYRAYTIQSHGWVLPFHEHPLQANPSDEQCIWQSLGLPNVGSMDMDQCTLRRVDNEGNLVKTQPQRLSDSPQSLQLLNVRRREQLGFYLQGSE